MLFIPDLGFRINTHTYLFWMATFLHHLSSRPGHFDNSPQKRSFFVSPLPNNSSQPPARDACNDRPQLRPVLVRHKNSPPQESASARFPDSFQGLSGFPNELSAQRHDCASRGSRQRLNREFACHHFCVSTSLTSHLSSGGFDSRRNDWLGSAGPRSP